MTETGNIAILCVPPHLFAACWRLCCGFLMRGLRVSAVSPQEAADNIADHGDKLWLIIRNNPLGLAGAFLTKIGADQDGKRIVGVYALAGRGVRAWAGLLGERMGQYAKEEYCSAVRFCGRRGWGRVLPSYRVIGEHSSGVAIYERGVA